MVASVSSQLAVMLSVVSTTDQKEKADLGANGTRQWPELTWLWGRRRLVVTLAMRRTAEPG